MNEDISKWHLYSIGTVANQLMVGNENIKVFLHERNGFLDGAIDSKSESISVKSSDGKVYAISTATDDTVEAIWSNPNSNRVTPPNVRPGEKVEIWKYADVDKYYWRTMGTELDLRGLEHIKYVFKNDVESKPVDDSNSYTFTISTLNKIVALNTSANNDELTSYNIGLDTKNGIFQLLDGKDNYIKLLSSEDTLDVKVNNNVTVLLSRISIRNEGEEIISLLLELIDAIINEQHIGNLGIDTKLNVPSIQKYEDIKSRLKTFEV